MKNNVKFLPCFLLIVTLLSSCTKNDPLFEGYETNPELRLVKATGSLSCAPPQFNSTANICNAAFTRYSGWTCSDATYSVPLGDGYTLWLFGDSFVGTVHPLDESHPNRWRFPQGLISNTFMVQDPSGTFRTIVGPGPIDPETWLYKPIVKTGKEDLSPSDREFYWPGDAEVKNGKVYIFFHKYKQYGAGAFDFQAIGADVFVFNVSTLKGFTDNVSKIAPLNVISYYSPSNPSSSLETLYGATLLKDGGYTIISIYPTKYLLCLVFIHPK